MVANSLGTPVAELLDSLSEDESLEHRISNFLFGQHVPDQDCVELDVHGGTVVLRGRLPSRSAKWLCIECCRRVAGVINIVDEIQVGSPDKLRPSVRVR